MGSALHRPVTGRSLDLLCQGLTDHWLCRRDWLGCSQHAHPNPTEDVSMLSNTLDPGRSTYHWFSASWEQAYGGKFILEHSIQVLCRDFIWSLCEFHQKFRLMSCQVQRCMRSIPNLGWSLKELHDFECDRPTHWKLYYCLSRKNRHLRPHKLAYALCLSLSCLPI